MKMRYPSHTPSARGFSLIDVLVAVVVLSVGLLALAVLQGKIVRGSSAAKAQTQALSLAQQTLEQLRGFKSASGGTDSYAAIADTTDSVTIGSTTFNRAVTVTRYQNTGTSFTAVANDSTVGLSVNEFKQVDVAVTWTDETGHTTTVNQSDVVSVTAPSDSLSALATPNLTHTGPKVYIDTTKFAAGVIPIALGNNQSAAASDPQPESFSTGHITTRFSVFDYGTGSGNTSNGYNLLNKQFDFALTSCTCNVSSNSTSSNPAYGPTYWNGTKYIAPSTVVGKPTGTDPVSNGNSSKSSQDPVLCTACCRDHHDVAVSSDYPVQVDPFRPTAEYSGGDHKHYNTDSSSPPLLQTTVVTGSGSEYYETCRLVRVDGINYVATDARRENHLLIAPVGSITVSKVAKTCDPTGDSITSGTCYDHALDTTTSGTTYPNFVKDYVNGYYSAFQSASTYPLAADGTSPAISDLLTSGGSPTTLATSYSSLVNPPTQTTLSLGLNATQYLEARGIYIDYIGTETKKALACIGSSSIDCAAYTSLTALQIIPFVAVNLTNLDNWQSSAVATLSLTNTSIPGGTYDPYIIGYTFDRGTVTTNAAGSASAQALSRHGNAGLTDSLTITPAYPFQAHNCYNTSTNATQAPCSADPPASGYAYDTTSINSERLSTDSQPYTVTGSGSTSATFNVSYKDNSSGKSNLNSSIAISVTTPTVNTPGCTLTKSKQAYTCNSTTTDTSIVLKLSQYNSQVSCSGKNCPSPANVNDYHLCSLTNVPTGMTYVIGSAVNATCYGAGDPATCTGPESTSVTFTLSPGSGQTISTLLAATTNMTAQFYPQATSCP